jgi:hypothetical protein
VFNGGNRNIHRRDTRKDARFEKKIAIQEVKHADINTKAAG